MSKTLKIGVIGTLGIPAKYGGFETLTEHLTRELNSKFEFTVYCSAVGNDHGLNYHNGAKLKYFPLKANGIQSFPYDVVSILHALRHVDVLLILGVSGCSLLPIIRRITKKKIIVNIDGLEWKREKWNGFAKKFLKYSEGLAVKNAHIIVADNVVIEEYVQKEYGVKATMIPYGGNHTIKRGLSQSTIDNFPFLIHDYAFKVCRIEPENNIELILDAFSRSPEQNLVLIGNWDNSTFSKEMRDQYSGFENLYLLDPIYDQKKLDEIRSNCLFYVHGHSAGGTNPSLVEAMFLGLPIVAFGVDYNRMTTQGGAIYFDSLESLVSILSSLDKQSLESIGSKMYAIAKEEYTWEKISTSYAQLF